MMKLLAIALLICISLCLSSCKLEKEKEKEIAMSSALTSSESLESTIPSDLNPSAYERSSDVSSGRLISHPTYPITGAVLKITSEVVTAYFEQDDGYGTVDLYINNADSFTDESSNTLTIDKLNYGDTITVSACYKEYYSLTRINTCTNIGDVVLLSISDEELYNRGYEQYQNIF